VAPWLYYARTRIILRCALCSVWRARSRQRSMDEREQIDWVVCFLFPFYMGCVWDGEEREQGAGHATCMCKLSFQLPGSSYLSIYPIYRGCCYWLVGWEGKVM
jgi:hypothetical protein